MQNEYFKWLCDLVCGKRYSKEISYINLLLHLYNTEFVYSIPLDCNRSVDGIDLRYRFAISHNYDADDIMNELNKPCSVLEMIIALSVRCEENIMDDPLLGDRTGQWFWRMIVNLGLGSMSDNNFNENQYINIIDRFLNRKYEPNGRGGLFTLRHCYEDLRDVEIWYQLCWYLDEIT